VPVAAGAGDELDLITALRAGDEAAFGALVDRYHMELLRLAQLYVHDRAVAEEVVQETWIGVLQGIDRFAGRSSLKTWICHILLNQARSRARREAPAQPFSSFAEDDDEPSVDPDRFLPDGHRFAGHWASVPADWEAMPEARLLAQETITYVQRSLAALPTNQQAVLRLRDVSGWSSAEVCRLLGISEANERVLLHRARSRVRQALEQYLQET
jgi:RNA polymerase sigma-70 factor (ECF subfamily)